MDFLQTWVRLSNILGAGWTIGVIVERWVSYTLKLDDLREDLIEVSAEVVSCSWVGRFIAKRFEEAFVSSEKNSGNLEPIREKN